MTDGHEATPDLPPEEWLTLGNNQEWGDPWGNPGHCHNLLDDYAEKLVACRVEIERLDALVTVIYNELEDAKALRRSLLELMAEDDGTYEWCIRMAARVGSLLGETPPELGALGRTVDALAVEFKRDTGIDT